jgi:hypothetical protein
MRTTAHIEDWQRRAGIEAARGQRADTLERLSQLGFELIKVVELERSGIRGGDGAWHGSDPIAGIVANIVEAEKDDLQAWQQGTQHQQDTQHANSRH